MFQADLLDSVPETRYLSADNYTIYRAVMRLFFTEYQKMHYQLDQDSLLALLHQLPFFAGYTGEELSRALEQLVKWRNLTCIQDPHRVRTIAEFQNRRLRYMMTPAALEVERMAVTLENLAVDTAGLPSGVFRRIQADLRRIPELSGLPLLEVGSWWQDLQDDFRRLSREHQDYLREFYASGAEKRMKAVDFVVYKQNLVRYLQAFIQDLQRSAAQIAAQLESLSREQVSGMLDRVMESELEIPRPQEPEGWQAALRAQHEAVWNALSGWFTGPEAVSRQVLEVTNEIIRRTVQNAVLLVQLENMGVSNKAELRHFLTLFAGCGSVEEAHRLSAVVFGAQQARHFSVNAARETDRIDLSTYEEPPVRYELNPHTRTYKPRMDRTGFSDKGEEKAARRRQILEAERALREEVFSYLRDGRLDFAALDRPVTPEVRSVFLSWITAAGLAEDGRGHTQYGQSFTMHRRGGQPCRMRCTDGVLTMPDCVLIFEEDGYV